MNAFPRLLFAHYCVGNVDPAAKKLVRVSYESLMKSIEMGVSAG